MRTRREATQLESESLVVIPSVFLPVTLSYVNKTIVSMLWPKDLMGIEGFAHLWKNYWISSYGSVCCASMM